MPVKQKKTRYKPVKKQDRKKEKIPQKNRVRQTNGLSLEEAQKLISKSYKN